MRRIIGFAFLGALAPLPAGAAGLDAGSLALGWGLPFAGLLLSIALLPLLAPHLWHRRYGLIALGWVAALVLPLAVAYGPELPLGLVRHTLLQEYLPFTALLLALYTTGGGVLLRGSLVGTPDTNTALLGFGTVIASVMGTTGASMLLIRPLLRANAHREHKTHTFVFFIFLVGNIGGALTPLGDPPLYLGFLRGVAFFWTTTHLFLPFAFCAALLLGAYWLLDRRSYAREPALAPPTVEPLAISGWVNVALVAVVAGVVLAQGVWTLGAVDVLGETMPAERLLAIAAFLAVTGLSLAVTPRGLRDTNGFTWGAMTEVGKLFAAIFVCMAPLLTILAAGRHGAAAPLVALTESGGGAPVPWIYFWLTGILSSFLDNAPTYLVFFNLAGGDPVRLMGPDAATLIAISCGAVFMGANTYIGNAPNFMVRAIVVEHGCRMPSFFGFMAWSGVVLLPLFVLVTLLFFR